MNGLGEKKDVIQGLFPTPVGFAYMPRAFTQDEIAWIASQESNSTLNLGGNQASNDTYVLESPALAELKAFCDAKVNGFFQEVYQPVEPVQIHITQSWVNISRKGQSHHLHMHPNSIFSGVLYIEAVDDSITLFHHPSNIFNYLQINAKTFNIFNARSWESRVETGQLILFHSSIVHGVKPLEHDNRRISLSFNTSMKGTIGDVLSKTRLEL